MILLKILFSLSLIATLAILFWGLYVYFKGGDLQKKYSNQAMQLRVFFQGLTLILFMLLLLSR